MKIWRISVPAAITVPVKLTINDIRIGLLVLEAGQSLVVRRDGDAVELDVTP